MFFVLSKVVFALIAPSNLSLLVMATGLALQHLTRFRKTGGWLVAGGFVMLLVIGFSPIGRWLTIPLEARFAEGGVPAGAAVSHIVFLGGFEQASVGEVRGQLAVNAAGERLLETVALARRHREAKVVFTGGYGWLVGTPVDATRSVAGYLEGAGIERERIIVEGRSRTTWENAVFVKRLIEGEGAGCPCAVALVTSAWHMPRAVGVFRKAGFAAPGWRLYPVPVDYRTRGEDDRWNPYFWMHEGVEQTDLAFKEWVGLAAYWLSGRTDALWPGPERSGQGSQAHAKKDR